MFSFYKMKLDEKFFILLNGIISEFEYSYKLISEFFCDEKYGIGASGIIIIEKSKVADIKMKMLDSDGIENRDFNTGIKCLVRYLYEHSDYKKIKHEVKYILEKYNIEHVTIEFEEKDEKCDNTKCDIKKEKHSRHHH